MTAETARLLETALALPAAERAEFVGQLLERLDGSTDPDFDAAWKAEIGRRLADYEAGRTRAIPWEELDRELRERSDARRR